MKLPQEAINALVTELEKRSCQIKDLSDSQENLYNKWRFIGYSEAYKQLTKELKSRGELSEWL